MAEGSEKEPGASLEHLAVLPCVVCGLLVSRSEVPGKAESDGWLIRVFDQDYIVHIGCLDRFWQEFDDEDLPHITMTTFGVQRR